MENVPTIPPPSEVSSTDPLSVSPPMQTEGGGLLLPATQKDLTGLRFGELLVESYAGRSSHREHLWNVVCSCGKRKTVSSHHLRSGNTISCGHVALERAAAANLVDLTGKRFGRLLVLSRTPAVFKEKPRWLVRCDCGVEKIVLGSNLCKSNRGTQSCGCLAREIASTPDVDLIGQRFGRLIVETKAPYIHNRAHQWITKCDCGESRTVVGSSLLNGTITTCKTCAKKSLSTFASSRIGNLNSNWNPTLTQEDRDRGRLGTCVQKKWKAVADVVRRRDRATCLICGERGLCVHHLEPWAFDRDLRYDPANLVTLCKECHDQFHLLYGKDCTLEDFEDYLKP